MVISPIKTVSDINFSDSNFLLHFEKGAASILYNLDCKNSIPAKPTVTQFLQISTEQYL